MQNSLSALNQATETETVSDFGAANIGSHHIQSVRTDSEGWQNACRELAQSKKLFEVDGLCTDSVHSFYKDISSAYDYEFILRDCTMVFTPRISN
jgi:hypothetical protein